MKKLTKILLLVAVLVLSLVLATACETLENHEHTPAAEWTSDGTSHYHACTFEGCTEKLDVTVCAGGTATCTTKATCSTCGKEYGQELGHTEVVDAAVAPTCTATGLTEGKHCSACDEVLVAQTEVTATGHTEETVAGTAATCTATGWADGKKCSVCDTVLSAQIEIAVLGHDMNDGVVTTPATCEVAGVKIYSCQRENCNHSTTEVVAALGHNWVVDETASQPATWTAAGVKVEVCDREGCDESKETTIECLTRTLVVDNGDDVVATWDVKKYDNGWVTTGATATVATGASHDESNALAFKVWHNTMSFRFSTALNTEGKDYNLLAVDIQGDGKAMVKVRLANSQTGVYITYTLPVALVEGWNHYELSLADSAWALEGVTSTDINQFDSLQFIFQTNVSGGPSVVLNLDNMEVKNVETPATAITSLEQEVGQTALLTLDFEDGAGSGKYTNSAWTQDKYTDSWVTMTEQMNSRQNPAGTSKIVNFVCYQGMTYRYTYTIGYTLASVNSISVDLGNYYSPNETIKYKIALVDENGTAHYLGGSSDWISFAANSGLETVTYTFDAPVTNIVAIRVVTQGTSGNQYLYCDNIILK